MEDLTHLLPAKLLKDAIWAWTPIDNNYSINTLDTGQRREYDAFESESRRREYLATRWLIHHMLEDAGKDAKAFQLHKNEFGKPWGSYKGEKFYVSIAHTNEHVICALSTQKAIGVDMEPVDRKVPEKLRKRMLHASEIDLLKEQESIRIWTLKEAMVKLQGKGMRTNLNECTLSSISENYISAALNNDKKVHIHSFIYENNWLAMAWYF